MALTSNKEKANDEDSSKEKKELPPTKVIVRRLPPTLTSEMFLEQISPIPKHDYFCFSKADMSLGIHAFSRAYINFLDQNDLVVFTEKFDGYVFVDSKGNEYPAVVEFAPFQKVPKRKTKKVDSRAGTIEQDAEYKAFLEKLENPEHEPLLTIESVLEEIEMREKEKKANAATHQTTPLLEYIKKRREEKRSLLLRAKDEKRRKELERKKTRDEERRRQKDAGHGRVSDRDIRKDDKRGSKDLDKRDSRPRSISEKEKSSERDLRAKGSKERDILDRRDRDRDMFSDGKDQADRVRKSSSSEEKRPKGDITVRVLRNPEREKFSPKPRESPKPKDGGTKSDHYANRSDDKNTSGSRGNAPRGDKPGFHGSKARDDKYGKYQRESPSNDRPVARDGNRGNKPESRPDSGKDRSKARDSDQRQRDGNQRSRDDANQYGGRQNQDRGGERDGRKRDDRRTDAGRPKSGSTAATNKERSDKPVKEETSAAATKPAANESKAEYGQQQQTSVDSASARRESKRNAEAERLRRTRNKDRPEREIYVPGRRRVEASSDKKSSTEKETNSDKGDEKGDG